MRIPLRAPSFLFNDLAFLWIPRKPVKFLALLFSIPTAPTKLTHHKCHPAESVVLTLFVVIKQPKPLPARLHQT